MAQSLGSLSGLCLLGMWWALESDHGPMAGALIVLFSVAGIGALLAL